MSAFHILLALALASPEQLAEQLRLQGATGIRVQLAQLDEDPAMEALVQYELPGSGVHAKILDLGKSGWQTAGSFNTWWEFKPEDAERFIEFRETVRLGVQDVVVRTRSGGTEASQTTVEVFRMKDGALAGVLRMKEREVAMEHPSGDVFTTEAKITIEPGKVTVRSIRHPGGIESCRLHTWDAERFTFLEGDCL